MGTLAVLICLGTIGALPTAARAQEEGPSDEYWGMGVGPTFAWGTAGSTLGWELSGTFRHPWVHFSVGGDYVRDGSTQADTYYVAWEPGVFAGLSIGVSATEQTDENEDEDEDEDEEQDWSPTRVDPMLGVWGGAALPLILEEHGYNGDYNTWSGLWFSFALGYRYVGGEHQFYIAPKLNGYSTPSPNS